MSGDAIRDRLRRIDSEVTRLELLLRRGGLTHEERSHFAARKKLLQAEQRKLTARIHRD